MKRTITTGLLLLTLSAFAQEKSVVQRAMRDELDRSMKELKADGFDKPFFISYSLEEFTTYYVAASLGALERSIERKDRSALSVRLMVGDYDFNDESLDNNVSSQSSGIDLDLPVDDDYLGIRRYLWASTDQVYRSASRKFARNQQILKEQGKPLAELPHRTFAKVAPSKIDIPAPDEKFDKAKTEELLKKLTGTLTGYASGKEGFNGVSAYFVYRKGYRYLENSEGSSNRVAQNGGSLVISANFLAPDNETVYDQIIHWYETLELESLDQLIAEGKQLIDELQLKVKAPEFDEEYVGPIIIEGDELAELLLLKITSGEDVIVASDYLPRLSRYASETGATMDSKIGKPIFADGLTIKSTPKLTTYRDKKLTGTFQVDTEGVVPPDELVLVENGVLKALLNDRTLTSPTQTANGFSSGQGVFQMSLKNTVPAASMKARLIDEAKKQGLEYALWLKSRLEASNGKFFDVYKVYVADGREELFRGAWMNRITPRNFKKIACASLETDAYPVNRLGTVPTVICPQAMLFEEVEVKGMSKNYNEDTQYVSSPLKK